MRVFIVLFVLLLQTLRADDDWICNANDLALHQCVNVLTGHLNLTVQDTVVQGAEPLFLTRSYSSLAAIVYTPETERNKSYLLRPGKCNQGGWNLFPHLQMSISYKKLPRGKYAPTWIGVAEENGLMPPKENERLKTMVLYVGLAPNRPLPKKYALEAKNIYSDKDGATGRYVSQYTKNKDYDITILPCKLTKTTFGLGDHYHSSPTYQEAYKNHVELLMGKYNFYAQKTR